MLQNGELLQAVGVGHASIYELHVGGREQWTLRAGKEDHHEVFQRQLPCICVLAHAFHRQIIASANNNLKGLKCCSFLIIKSMMI